MSDAFAALRLPAVRSFILGRAANTLAGQMLATAVGWDIYERTGSKVALGLVGLVQVVPVLLFALPAGQLIDRHNRRDATVWATLGHLLAGLLLAVGVGLGASVSLVFVALFLNGMAKSVSNPAAGALYAQIVPPEHFVNANAWRSTSVELAATIGPALGGLLIAATAGATLVYALNAAGALVFVVVVLTIPRPPTPPPERQGGPGIYAGIRFVFRTELLLAAITLDLFAVLFGGATALLPVFAKDILHVGPSGLGVLRAAPAIGAVLMALITTRLPPWRRSGAVLITTVAGFGAATIVFGWSHWFWVSFIALFFTGVFDNISVVIRLTLEQLIVPESLRGRVGAVHGVFIGLSNEMGELESGLAAAWLGSAPSVIAGGAITLLVVGIAAWRWPSLRRLGTMASIEPASESAADEIPGITSE